MTNIEGQLKLSTEYISDNIVVVNLLKQINIVDNINKRKIIDVSKYEYERNSLYIYTSQSAKADSL